MRISFRHVAAIAAMVAPTVVSAVTCGTAREVTSGAKTVSVAELYTSEGCDSCPPADRWFSTLMNGAVVPLAFHVDYWDYIGWKDRFAQASFTTRQRAAVSLQGSRTVYTPQVMLDGKDARQWSAGGGAFDARVRELSMRAPRASLKLVAEPGATSARVSVNVSQLDAAARRDAVLFVAVTENNLVSRVTAGENRGATLKHDHVVRELSRPIPLADAGNIAAREITILLPADAKRAELEVVAFVQDQKTGEILQAVSGALCAK